MENNDAAWLQVPWTVRDLFIKYASTARRLVEAAPDAEAWAFDTDECGVVVIKHAGLGAATDGMQRALGGPNPATSMLLGGALGAGLGYGGGWLAHKIAPDYLADTLPNVAMPVGALLGAGLMGIRDAVPNLYAYGWDGMSRPTPAQSGEPYPDWDAAHPNGMGPDGKPDWGNDAETLARLRGADQQRSINRADANEMPSMQQILDKLNGIQKASNYDNYQGVNYVNNGYANTGDLYVPSVHVNAWGEAVGRDPYMNPMERAMAAGPVFGAGASRGSDWVTPMDVGRVALNAGLGYIYGRGLGLIAGPFLQLTPKAQNDIQNAGLLAGAVKALAAEIS